MGRVSTHHDNPGTFGQAMLIIFALIFGGQVYAATQRSYAIGEVVAVREVCKMDATTGENGRTRSSLQGNVPCDQVEAQRALRPNLRFSVTPRTLYEFSYSDTDGRAAHGFASSLGFGQLLGLSAPPEVGDRMLIGISPDAPTANYPETVTATYKLDSWLLFAYFLNGLMVFFASRSAYRALTQIKQT
jgi:hypothetical protein